MKPWEKLALGVLGAVSACAGAMAVVWIDRLAQPSQNEVTLHAAHAAASGGTRKADRLSVSPAILEQERLAYAPFDLLALRDTFGADDPAGWATLEANENPDTWAAETNLNIETRREAPDSVVKLPPVTSRDSLPWASDGKNHNQPEKPARTYTLKERLAEISPAAGKRLAAKFEAANATWPPAEAGLIALKDKKVLDLYTRAKGGSWQLIHRYPVLAASGATGPKLRQGDKQVPEGVYNISLLNPNSRYHVSLRVNYPNAFDRKMAAKDGRKELGGDIMIHGKAVSIGCLAIGDEAAEELFVLAAQIGLPRMKLIIAPQDFRYKEIPQVAEGQPAWVTQLYAEVALAMKEFPAPPASTSLLSFFEN
jgi:hypothetical protein